MPDEGEPGTFKDRFYLLRDVHRFLEGTLIAAHIIDAEDVYIYLRDEYPAALKLLPLEIAKLPAGGPRIHMRRGAGAYICGEESALLESIEGKRGLPRHKPPYPFQVGLFGLPTLINNLGDSVLGARSHREGRRMVGRARAATAVMACAAIRSRAASGIRASSSRRRASLCVN